MTTPIRAQPVGPISANEDVVLVSIIDGALYALCVGTVNPTFYKIYQSDGSINPYVTSNIIIASISGAQNHLVMIVNSPQQYKGYILAQSGNVDPNAATMVLIDSNTTPVPYGYSVATSSKYVVPPGPGIFLSGVGYKFYGSRTNTTDFTPLNSDKTASTGVQYAINEFQTTLSTELIYPLPVIIYQNIGNVCKVVTTSPFDVINVFYCSICSTVSGACSVCANVGNKKAWARLSDCNANYDYVYCTIGEYCGSCYGPCQMYGTCNMNTKNDGFQCAIPPSPIKPVIPWYRSIWFLVIVLLLVFLSIIITIYYIFYRHPTVHEYSHTDMYSSNSGNTVSNMIYNT